MKRDPISLFSRPLGKWLQVREGVLERETEGEKRALLSLVECCKSARPISTTIREKERKEVFMPNWFLDWSLLFLPPLPLLQIRVSFSPSPLKIAFKRKREISEVCVRPCRILISESPLRRTHADSLLLFSELVYWRDSAISLPGKWKHEEREREKEENTSEWAAKQQRTGTTPKPSRMCVAVLFFASCLKLRVRFQAAKVNPPFNM